MAQAIRAIACLGLALMLGACNLYPPKDGVGIDGKDGVDAVLHRFGIAPLDPNAPLLEQVLQRAAQTDPAGSLRGVTYNLTTGNRLPADWIVQTPDVWGSKADALAYQPLDCRDCDPDFKLRRCQAAADCTNTRCAPLHAAARSQDEPPQRFCLGHSEALIDRFYDLIVTAERAVDIVLLAPPPDLRFRAGLRNAITRLSRSGRPVSLRIMIGTYPPDQIDLPAFARDLMRDVGSPSPVSLSVATTRSCDGEETCGAYSWNHAKLVAVDGRAALVGGHNMWTEDYLLDDPVHDLSMQIAGPAARDAHGFADALWQVVCGRSDQDKLNVAYRVAPAAEGGLQRGCLPAVSLPHPVKASGGLSVLSTGRLANGIGRGFAEQSRVVENLMLNAARRNIRMVQQDVAFSLVGGVDQQWPKSAIDAIVELIALRGGDAYLVLSDFGADGHVSDYSNRVGLDAVVRHLHQVMGRRFAIAEPDLSALVCQHLHVAPLRFGPDETWPERHPIGLHAKMWMVDDRAFYIGSENLYPTELQEFGYAVEDAAAVRMLKRDFWDKAWSFSQRAAISGSEAVKCVLEAKGPQPK